MNQYKYCLLLLVILHLGCTNSKTPEIVIEIDQLIEENPEIESVSIGLVYPKGEIEIHRGFLLNKTEPNSASLYEIASLTKTFAGTLLAIAIDENRITLDEDIRIHLPNSLNNLEYNHQPITFRHLVTHRSGLPLFFPHEEDLFKNEINWDTFPFEWNSLQEGFTRDDFFESLSEYQLTEPPGSRVSYSNAGANLIGYLLESIYQKPFTLLLDEYLLTPLEMNKTSIGLPESKMNRLVSGFNANRVIMPIRGAKSMSAEGGLVSCTGDMIRYMKHHLTSKESYLSIAHKAMLPGNEEDYHRGLFWQLNDNGRIYQHGGAFGTSSIMKLDLEARIGIFIVTNSSGPEVHPKLEHCVDRIINEIL